MVTRRADLGLSAELGLGVELGLETTCEVVSMAADVCLGDRADKVDKDRAAVGWSSGDKAAGGPAATAAAALAKRDRDKGRTSGAAGKSPVDTASETDMLAAAANTAEPVFAAV
jgi:hypothetical protein